MLSDDYEDLHQQMSDEFSDVYEDLHQQKMSKEKEKQRQWILSDFYEDLHKHKMSDD